VLYILKGCLFIQLVHSASQLIYYPIKELSTFFFLQKKFQVNNLMYVLRNEKVRETR